MKIAIWHNLPSGGGKRALYNHVRGLTEKGHTVESWCPPTADQTFLPLDTLIREHVVDMAWPVPANRLDDWQITLHTERSLAAMEAHCRACADAIDSAGFDIVFANSCQYFRTTPIGRLCRTPSVLYLQEPYRWLYEALPQLCWLAPPRRPGPWWTLRNARAAFIDLRRIRNLRVQAREEVENAKAFRRILVNSFFSRESVLRAYGLDATVCYLGIDLGKFAYAEGKRDDTVVGLGSITREKNPGFCIEAIAAMAPPRPRLIWIGNFAQEDYLDELKLLAHKLGVQFEPHIRVSDTELTTIVGQATAMVYAPRLEPFGLAPLEANAMGVPVVAVAEGGVRETVVDGVTGLLVERDPAAVAEGLSRLRADQNFARHLGRQARAEVEARWGLPEATDRLETQLLRFARTPVNSDPFKTTAEYPFRCESDVKFCQISATGEE